jgi:GT2 family glycosyltransferase
MRKKVSIITVNYNQDAMTEAVMDSILKTVTYAPLEILVVDNGSRVNPVPKWEQKYPTIKFLRCDLNVGFAGGNNIAVKEATGEYLFLVNNDTEFTEGLIDKLAETLDTQPEVGMVCPKIRYHDQPELLQYVGFTKMNYFTARNKCIGHLEEDLGQYDNKSGVTAFPNGAAMMVRKKAMEKAGMMTEIYFLYYEELDWYENFIKAGYSAWVNLDAVIYHKESITVGRNSALKEYFMNRNRILYIRRNCSLPVQTVFWVYFISFVTPRNIATYVKDKQWSFIPVLFKAIFWNMTHKKNSPKLGYKFER